MVGYCYECDANDPHTCIVVYDDGGTIPDSWRRQLFSVRYAYTSSEPLPEPEPKNPPFWHYFLGAQRAHDWTSTPKGNRRPFTRRFIPPSERLSRRDPLTSTRAHRKQVRQFLSP